MKNDIFYGYCSLLEHVYDRGIVIASRNGLVRQLVGESLKIELSSKKLQLINGRPFYYKGVLGELAALLRKPKHIDDFKKWGCNYWDQFGDKNGNLKLDYGNAWFVNGSFDRVVRKLRAKQFTRDLIINNWMTAPEKLTLPCCWFAIQLIQVDADSLDLVWYQRSADLLVGVPSDLLLAQVLLILFAKEAGLKPNCVSMMFGSAHIYEQHIKDGRFYEYLRAEESSDHIYDYRLIDKPFDIYDFRPEYITINYKVNKNDFKFECIK